MQARDFVWLPLVAFLLASSGGQAASAQAPDRIARLIGDASVPNVNFAAGHANSVAPIRDTGFRVVRTATRGDREAVVPAGACVLAHSARLWRRTPAAGCPVATVSIPERLPLPLTGRPSVVAISGATTTRPEAR